MFFHDSLTFFLTFSAFSAPDSDPAVSDRNPAVSESLPGKIQLASLRLGPQPRKIHHFPTARYAIERFCFLAAFSAAPVDAS